MMVPVFYQSDRNDKLWAAFKVDIENPNNETHYLQLVYERLKNLGKSGNPMDDTILQYVDEWFSKHGHDDGIGIFLEDLQRLEDGKASMFAIAAWPYLSPKIFEKMDGSSWILVAKGREFSVFCREKTLNSKISGKEDAAPRTLFLPKSELQDYFLGAQNISIGHPPSQS